MSLKRCNINGTLMISIFLSHFFLRAWFHFSSSHWQADPVNQMEVLPPMASVRYIIHGFSPAIIYWALLVDRV